MPSMTARTRPARGSATVSSEAFLEGIASILLGLEKHRRQRRQSKRQRVEPAMGGGRRRRHPSQIANAAAAVYRGIAVQDLSPAASDGDAHHIVWARDRREIAHHEDWRSRVR